MTVHFFPVGKFSHYTPTLARPVALHGRRRHLNYGAPWPTQKFFPPVIA
ncbi:MAG: hypothetical protein H6R15_1433 [Proteobacteria bacterium]|nr:hypothetical protein [Pseudomonadota bacterium]